MVYLEEVFTTSPCDGDEAIGAKVTKWTSVCVWVKFFFFQEKGERSLGWSQGSWLTLLTGGGSGCTLCWVVPAVSLGGGERRWRDVQNPKSKPQSKEQNPILKMELENLRSNLREPH